MDVCAHLKPFIEILAFKVMLTCRGLWRTKTRGQTFMNRISNLHPYHRERTQQERVVYESDKEAVPRYGNCLSSGFPGPQNYEKYISMFVYYPVYDILLQRLREQLWSQSPTSYK